MLDRLLPKVVDNTYSGHVVALYFFFFITLLTVVRSLLHIVLADGGAQSIATIPLDSYTQAGAQTVVFVFALWGLVQLIMGIMYVIVAIRYKALIPLMYVFMLLDWGSRLALGLFKTMETTGTAPGANGNIIFTIVIPIMLYLALKTSKDVQAT